MAFTKFGELQPEQITNWNRVLWKNARNKSWLNTVLGTSANSVVQHVKELTVNGKGARAAITLVPDGENDGVAGDRNLEGRESALTSVAQYITIDQLAAAHINKGVMDDQRTIVNFRVQARDALEYWLSDRIDQLAFLTLAGIDYKYRPDGSERPIGDPDVVTELHLLDFAQDVSPPTERRRIRWAKNTADSDGALVVGGVSGDVVATDTITWNMIVRLKAWAHSNYIKPVRGPNGEDLYHLYVPPFVLADLKLDPAYMQAVTHAAQRGDKNKLFSGGILPVDGIYVHEHRWAPSTIRAPAGSKYGSTGNIDGAQLLFCGAQALAFADLDSVNWCEKKFDYDRRKGISAGRIIGFKKPLFPNRYTNGQSEDHGVVSVYVATKGA
ncbi:MAG: DUF4043 family protein [Bifidobacteriaceae bacterium]|jgi:N4-gp56 family major capsid protein|nr:DUF4043 family protein [Bifidobacteriaceae bacterium]